jgi:hypothetical protein
LLFPPDKAKYLKELSEQMPSDADIKRQQAPGGTMLALKNPKYEADFGLLQIQIRKIRTEKANNRGKRRRVLRRRSPPSRRLRAQREKHWRHRPGLRHRWRSSYLHLIHLLSSGIPLRPRHKARLKKRGWDLLEFPTLSFTLAIIRLLAPRPALPPPALPSQGGQNAPPGQP